MTGLLRPSLPLLLLPGLLLFCLPVSGRAQSPAAPADREALKAELVKTEADSAPWLATRAFRPRSPTSSPPTACCSRRPQQFRRAAAVARRYGDSRPSGLLTWAPSFVDVAASGDFGYTWGRYEYRATGPDGQPRTATGYFPHHLEAPARRHLALRHGHRRARPAGSRPRPPGPSHLLQPGQKADP